MSNSTDVKKTHTGRPEEIDKYLFTPVHAQSWPELLRAVPKRLVGLISKALGIKMVMFATATVIFVKYHDFFPWYAWLIVYILTLFGWDALKYLDKIKK